MKLRQLVKSSFYEVQRRWGRWASRRPTQAENAIAVFTVHSIAPARSDMAVSVTRFRQQLEGLLAAGYRALTIDQLLAVQSRKAGPCDPAFALTFDDGYRSVLTEALPVLEALQIPATVFLTTGFLDRRVSPPWRSTDPDLQAEYRKEAQFFQPLTWDEARTLARHPLIRIGGHTDTHPLLGLLTADAARDELRQSKAILRNQLGIETNLFAYPFGVRRYGAYSKHTEQLLRDTGYVCSMTSEISRARVGAGPWQIPRISLTQQDENRDAVAKAAGAYDWVGAAQGFYQSLFPNPHLGTPQ